MNVVISDMDIRDIVHRDPAIRALHEKMVREYDDYYEAELQEAIFETLVRFLAPRLGDMIRDTAEMVKESMAEMAEMAEDNG
jgi:hypothetical protein